MILCFHGVQDAHDIQECVLLEVRQERGAPEWMRSREGILWECPSGAQMSVCAICADPMPQ